MPLKGTGLIWTLPIVTAILASCGASQTPKSAAQDSIPQPPERSRPLNILFLYTDEQRYDTLAAYGNAVIRMPNIDRLASRSTVFDRAYVTQPICTPSRSTLLTGLYPHTTGLVRNNIPLRSVAKCLPEMLPPGAYACANMGKWHLGDEIYPQHGFPAWLATEDTYHRYYSKRYNEYADRSAYHHWLIARGVRPSTHAVDPQRPWLNNRFFREQIHALPEEHCKPRFLAEAASRFIRDHAQEPFVLYVSFLEPHMPFTSCRDGQYKPSEVNLPANFNVPLSPQHRLHARVAAARYRAEGFEGQRLETEADWRQLIARYWGLCSLVDTHAGTILDTLRDCGLEDRTVIVFTSDHGDMMGSHGLLTKGLMYEEAVRVPLLIRLPGRRQGRRVAAPVSNIDIVPTLLDMLGQPIPSHLQGRSLRPVLEGRADRPDRDVFVEWPAHPAEKAGKLPDVPAALAGTCTPEQAAASERDSIRTIVTADGWKLNLSAVGEHDLFDLNADPGELVNLAADPRQAERIKDLTRRIRDWQRRTRDPEARDWND
jgi:arylsulfatase